MFVKSSIRKWSLGRPASISSWNKGIIPNSFDKNNFYIEKFELDNTFDVLFDDPFISTIMANDKGERIQSRTLYRTKLRFLVWLYRSSRWYSWLSVTLKKIIKTVWQTFKENFDKENSLK